MFHWIRGRQLMVATTIASAFYGPAAIAFGGGLTDDFDLGITIARYLPLALPVVMFEYPRHFWVQAAQWLKGMLLSVVLVMGYIFYLAHDTRPFWECVTASFKLSILLVVFGSFATTSLMFFLGAFINFFQKKPSEAKDYVQVFD